MRREITRSEEAWRQGKLMSNKVYKALSVRNREQWRKWLRDHHSSVSEIWLIFYKHRTGKTSLTYEDALEEALCYGWVDSLVKRLDDKRYARKFTPRTPDSKWSTANRRRYEDLKLRGLLAPPGINRPPTNRSGDAPPRPSVSDFPAYIKEALNTNPAALKYFEELAPSYQRTYVGWIDSAKRLETKERRLNEALKLLAAGKKLGLK
jgi:uncharacterized protein YdeI (YjbR/CyaY-like superfamily)